MPNQQIVDYIKTEKAKGVKVEQITMALMASGWDANSITQAVVFTETGEVMPNVPPPAPPAPPAPPQYGTPVPPPPQYGALPPQPPIPNYQPQQPAGDSGLGTMIASQVKRGVASSVAYGVGRTISRSLWRMIPVALIVAVGTLGYAASTRLAGNDNNSQLASVGASGGGDQLTDEQVRAESVAVAKRILGGVKTLKAYDQEMAALVEIQEKFITLSENGRNYLKEGKYTDKAKEPEFLKLNKLHQDWIIKYGANSRTEQETKNYDSEKLRVETEKGFVLAAIESVNTPVILAGLQADRAVAAFATAVYPGRESGYRDYIASKDNPMSPPAGLEMFVLSKKMADLSGKLKWNEVPKTVAFWNYVHEVLDKLGAPKADAVTAPVAEKCQRYLYNGTPAAKIDLGFIFKQSEGNNAKELVDFYIKDGLQKTEPFKSNIDKFNVWYRVLDEKESKEYDIAVDKTVDMDNTWLKDYCGNSDITVMYSPNQKWREAGLVPGWQRSYTKIIALFEPENANVFVHEMGHAMGLADEYVENNNKSRIAKGSAEFNCAGDVSDARWSSRVSNNTEADQVHSAASWVGYFTGNPKNCFDGGKPIPNCHYTIILEHSKTNTNYLVFDPVPDPAKCNYDPSGNDFNKPITPGCMYLDQTGEPQCRSGGKNHSCSSFLVKRNQAISGGCNLSSDNYRPTLVSIMLYQDWFTAVRGFGELASRSFGPVNESAICEMMSYKLSLPFSGLGPVCASYANIVDKETQADLISTPRPVVTPTLPSAPVKPQTTWQKILSFFKLF